MTLTQEQIETFQTEGWLFLPEVFDAEEVALLKTEAAAIYAQHRPEVWREKNGAPRTAFAVHTYSEPFRLLGAHPRLIGPVEQIFGEKLYMHQFKINARSAFTGEVWRWHQDYGAWKRDDGMPEPRAMNISVFLDEVMPVNGPLLLVPKSQTAGDLKASHDKETTSYPLWTLDEDTVTRLVREGGIVGHRNGYAILHQGWLQSSLLHMPSGARLTCVPSDVDRRTIVSIALRAGFGLAAIQTA
jgi:ectoine hydroxylase